MSTKIPRNAPCPCGSGKKYKKCCLRKDREKEAQRRQSEPLIIPANMEDQMPSVETLAEMGESMGMHLSPSELQQIQRTMLHDLDLEHVVAFREKWADEIAQIKAHTSVRNPADEDPEVFEQKITALFQSERFSPLLLSIEEVDNILQEVGFFELPEIQVGEHDDLEEEHTTLDDIFEAGMVKVFETYQTPELAEDLMAFVPGLLEEERWEDAFQTHRMAECMLQYPEDPSPLLAIVWQQSLLHWQEEQSKLEALVLSSVGLDVEDLRNMDVHELEEVLSSIEKNPEAKAAMNSFLKHSPFVQARSQSSSAESEEALLAFAEVHGSTLVSPDEMRPWVQHVLEILETFDEEELKEEFLEEEELGDDEGNLSKVLVETITELIPKMNRQLFTHKRRQQLAEDFSECLRQAPHDEENMRIAYLPSLLRKPEASQSNELWLLSFTILYHHLLRIPENMELASKE